MRKRNTKKVTKNELKKVKGGRDLSNREGALRDIVDKNIKEKAHLNIEIKK